MCVKLIELPPRSGLRLSFGYRDGLEKVSTHGFGGSAWVGVGRLIIFYEQIVVFDGFFGELVW